MITGKGCYVEDVALPGAAHVVFFRSPYPCGRLTKCDPTGASEAPGVIAIYTGADIAHLGSLTVSRPFHVEVPDYPILAGETVLAVGQPLVAVVAETPNQARDAAERIAVEVEVEPTAGLVDQRGVIDDSSLICGIAENQALAHHWTAGDVDRAFAEGAHRLHASVQHPRLAPSPIEPRAAAADCDAAGRLTIWLSTQTPHRARSELADILRIGADRIRVIAPDVGGAFGMKASLYPEDVVVAWAALTLQRPVRWAAERSEDMLSATHGRGAFSEGELSVSQDGRFLALKARITCPLGYWLPTSAAIPAWNAARILPGLYDIDAVDIATKGVLSNTAPIGIYRGAGRPEACALMERLVEEAAFATGLDSVEVRRRNLLPATSLPHTGPTGTVLDSGDYAAALTRLCEEADYDGLLRQRERRRRSGEIVGIGVAVYVEPCGRGWESATVTLNPDGTVVAGTGTSSQGQGRETAFAQIVADELAVPVDKVTVVHGNTDSAPAGIGALASRSTPIGGSALKQAAIELRTRIDGECRRPVTASVTYEADGEAWSYGCCLACVFIDADTGSLKVERISFLDDAGPPINPMLVDGQIRGGIAQGLGESVLEQIIYDDNGQLLTGSFTDYALPRADDMPHDIQITSLQTPSPFNLIGSKGVGEAGTIGTPAAILNAASDAVRPFGAGRLNPPLTSEKLWQAVRGGSRGDAE